MHDVPYGITNPLQMTAPNSEVPQMSVEDYVEIIATLMRFFDAKYKRTIKVSIKRKQK
jgi:hypothetical protein